MTFTLCELRKKEIIDVCNGDRLGFPDDLVVDSCGNVICIQLTQSCFRLSFSKGEPRTIPWKCIERITSETIWVKSKS